MQPYTAGSVPTGCSWFISNTLLLGELFHGNSHHRRLWDRDSFSLLTVCAGKHKSSFHRLELPCPPRATKVILPSAETLTWLFTGPRVCESACKLTSSILSYCCLTLLQLDRVSSHAHSPFSTRWPSTVCYHSWLFLSLIIQESLYFYNI